MTHPFRIRFLQQILVVLVHNNPPNLRHTLSFEPHQTWCIRHTQLLGNLGKFRLFQVHQSRIQKGQFHVFVCLHGDFIRRRNVGWCPWLCLPVSVQVLHTILLHHCLVDLFLLKRLAAIVVNAHSIGFQCLEPAVVARLFSCLYLFCGTLDLIIHDSASLVHPLFGRQCSANTGTVVDQFTLEYTTKCCVGYQDLVGVELRHEGVAKMISKGCLARGDALSFLAIL
mmetsp:Transcript_8066/g.12478  ORF Transcript_8066/g.12478 Transcript_8066/m.12478 type:complete len:226 (+) Transcript_8066:893-1570(+)